MTRLHHIFAGIFIVLSSITYAQIKADFEMPESQICAGEIATVIGHSPNAQYYFWNFGESPNYYPTLDSISGHRYYSPGTYIIKLLVKDAMGNADSIEKTIQVLPQPSASFSLNQYPNMNGVYCISTEFSISQWGNISGFDSLHWDFGDGFTSLVKYPYHTYADTGMYMITLDAVGKCGTDRQSETVYIVNDERAKPELRMYFSSDVFCPGTEIDLSAGLYDEVLKSFTLYTGDGNSTSLDEFSYTYPNKGEYTIMAVAENNCGIDTFTYKITIGDDMDNRPYLYAQNIACVGTSSVLRLGSRDESFASAVVDFGDGTIETITNPDEDIIHQYASGGNYTVSAIFTYSNCAQPDTVYTSANVQSSPNTYPFYVNVYPSTVCPNEPVNVYGPQIQIGDTLVYDFGDGNRQTYADDRPNVEHTYASPGTYKVMIYRTLVCGTNTFKDSAFNYVEVDGSLITELSLSANYSTQDEWLCAGDSIILQMSNYYHPFTNPRIKLPDGTIYNSEEAKVVFTQVGNYPIIASAINKCGIEIKAAYTVAITDKMINPSVGGYYYPRTQCVNQEFLFDLFVDNTTSTFWNFGDGTTLDNPPGPHILHLYTEPGAYDVQITATNGCGETVRKMKLYAEPGPEVAFEASKLDILKGETVDFTNQTTGAVETIWVFDLDETDTTIAQNTSRKYDEVGTYTVTLFALNEFGCWDTLTKTINVTIVNMVDKFGETVLNAYPNPSNGSFHINTYTTSAISQLYISDLTGKQLFTQSIPGGNNTVAINANHLPQGTYIIRLQTADNVYTSKLLIVQ